jgi:hypothetical protein
VTATAQKTPSLRWSSVRDCPRKAVYEATNAPARERTDRENRWLFRGRTLGRDFAEMLAQAQGCVPVRYGAEGWETARFVTEYQVKWALGTGHMDVLARDTGSAIEVLSSAHASEQMVHSKLVQLVGYVTHCDEATGPAALVILNPSDYSEDRIVVAQDTKRWRVLVQEVEDRIAEVQRWNDEAHLPARVCSKPSDAVGHFCVYADHCFGGWMPPPLNLVDDPVALELAVRLYHTKKAEREVNGTLKVLTSERQEIEQRLADIVPVGASELGSLKVTRTHVQRQPTLDFRKAELAGAVTEEELAEFFKPGAAYDTYRVDRLTDDPIVDVASFGDEVPF